MKIRLEKYVETNTVAVYVYNIDCEPHGILSTCVPNTVPPLEIDEFVAKLYSENRGWAQDLIDGPDFIITDKVLALEYTDCPICKVSPSLVKRLFEETYNSRTDIYEADPFLWELYAKLVDPSFLPEKAYPCTLQLWYNTQKKN